MVISLSTVVKNNGTVNCVFCPFIATGDAYVFFICTSCFSSFSHYTQGCIVLCTGQLYIYPAHPYLKCEFVVTRDCAIGRAHMC